MTPAIDWVKNNLLALLDRQRGNFWSTGEWLLYEYIREPYIKVAEEIAEEGDSEFNIMIRPSPDRFIYPGYDIYISRKE